jgi:arabinogalactan oligomer/maltooligosaccharide transport system permease protein
MRAEAHPLGGGGSASSRPPVASTSAPSAAGFRITELADAGAAAGARGLARFTAYLYLTPALFTMTLLTFIPIALTITVAFTDWSLANFTDPRFIGLQNFVDLFTGPYSPVFVPTFIWNVAFAALAALTQYGVGLFVALLLNNRHMRETNFYRAILILPMAIPATLSIVAWQGLLQESSGQINNLLEAIANAIGWQGFERIPFLLDDNLAKVSIILVGIWFGFPWFMNMCLAALSSIPAELYEAAHVDGATLFQRFRHVTMPLLLSFTMPLMVASFAYNFTNFGAIYLLTRGNPVRVDTQWAGNTDILITVAYKLLGQPLYRYGLASAMALLLFVVVGSMALAQIRALRLVEEK